LGKKVLDLKEGTQTIYEQGNGDNCTSNSSLSRSNENFASNKCLWVINLVLYIIQVIPKARRT